MVDKQPSAKSTQGATKKRDSKKLVSDAQAPKGRPLWVQVLACVVLVGLIVTLIMVRSHNPRRKTSVAEAAEKASPDIAPMLLEIDDVACTLVERYPESPEALDVMARLHHMLGESEDAVQYWEECLKLSPDFCPAYRAIGLIYFEVGEHAKAIANFQKARELLPTSSPIAVELSQALIAHGKTEEAAEILHEDIERHPKAMASLAMLGHAYVQLRQFAEAKKYFLLALEIGPDYTNAYDGLVKACVNLGEEEQANEYAQKLREAKAKDYASHSKWLKTFDDKENVRITMGDIYAAAANVYLLHNDPQTAEEYLLKAAKLAPRNVPAREVLAWLYERQGRNEEAIQVLAQLSKIAPKSLSVQMSSGDLWIKMRRYDKAEQAYRKAIELTPNQAGGYAALAHFFLKFNRKLPEAKELALKALELEPVARHQVLYRAACERVSALDRNKSDH